MGLVLSVVVIMAMIPTRHNKESQIVRARNKFGSLFA
jgi:hypothetical protein